MAARAWRRGWGRIGPVARAAQGPAGSEEVSRRGKTYLAALVIASVVLLALFLYGLGAFNQAPSSNTVETTASTSYDTLASSVISSAANYAPAGYTQGSSRQLSPSETGLVSGGYALYSDQGGALANVTILVFGSPASAQAYVASVISNAKGLSGYSDATSTLTGFQHYGVCYGYAEGDPEGGEYVANGVCTKGNVYIQVHLAATSSLASAESDMAGFVGAAYKGLG
jgi:hypothetical protein